MITMPSTKTLAAAVIGLASFSAANAAVIITDWNYSISSYWSAFSPNPGVSISPDNTLLHWGTPAGPTPQSSLQVTDPAGGTVQTIIGGGVPAPANIAEGLTLTHTNFPISDYTTHSLRTATLTSQLTLFATAPAGSEGNPGIAPVSFDIKFSETPNVEPCAAPSPAGNPCNDIFVLTAGLLNASFTYLDQSYFINIFPTVDGALKLLSNAECAAAGAPNNCIGMTTVENEVSHLPFGLTISTRPLQVPEPGILALLGIGLFGAGFASRRRKQVN